MNKSRATNMSSNFKEVSWDNGYFFTPNNKLRAYLGSVAKGDPTEIRTPFAGKDVPVSAVVKQWLPHLKSLQQKWPTLYSYEIEQSMKIGPLSIRLPLSKRMKDINAYYEDVLKPSLPIQIEAVQAAAELYKTSKGLRLRSQDETTANMKLSTNSGSPFFSSKRRLVLHKSYPCKSNAIVQSYPLCMIDFPGYKQYKTCAVLGWRGQEDGPDSSKQRVVWMFPLSVNINELQVYQPLIKSFQNNSLEPAWISDSMVDYYITKLFNTKGDSNLVVCTDFKRFDQHFNVNLQRCALDILKTLFTVNESFQSWCDNVFNIKYSIPLTYKWGYVRVGMHGMASGSGGTNVDETLAHKALQYEAAIDSNTLLNPYSQCLGDDGILTYPGISADKVVKSYTKHGLTMESSKQYESYDDCIFLRRWHHSDYRIDNICVGVYPTCRALGRLCEQERYYSEWSREDVALRQLSILENIKWHPLREEFVEFCLKRDRYRLGIDIPGFMDNLVKVEQESKAKGHDFSTWREQVQSEVTGISDWWIVKYLKSKM